VHDDRPGRTLGDRGAVGDVRLVPEELRRVGIEAETDLATALFDERRQPVCKR